MTEEAILAAKKVKEVAPTFTPQITLVLGSGLGELADSIQEIAAIPYSELPGFHKPEVEGHAGQLLLGVLEDTQVICLQGRVHLYEGIDPKVIRTMVRTCHLLGCQTWFATNACGSLHASIGPGSLVVIKDHINFQYTNPLVGPNEAEFGPRFIGLDNAYDPVLREKLFAAAAKFDIPLRDGIYIAAMGPAFETPAEINAFRILGADVVGMSTVPEVIVARHCGMRVAVLSVVTNLAAGLHPTQLSHADTLRGAALGAEKMVTVVREFVRDSA